MLKKFILPIALSLTVLLSIFTYQLILFNDHRLHIVFCDVGQGDGILVRTPGGSTVLIDGGPDNSIINCLHKHLPFWQRDLSVVLMTHPHADHLQGLLYVLDRYTVNYFVTEDLKNKTFGYHQLLSKISEHQISSKYVLAGDNFEAGNVEFHIVGPTKAFLDATSPTHMIGENKEFASIETLVHFGNLNVLLTGDSQADELHIAIKSVGAKYLLPLSILQIPHHGSATGLDREVLQNLKPSLGVISVGLHNFYHHPNPFTLILLKEAQVPFKRTDQTGDVEIVSDGDKWWVR